MSKKEIFDIQDGQLITHTVTNVDAVIADNKRLYNSGDGYSESRDMQRLAQLPMSVFWDLVARGIVNNPDDPYGKRFTKWLNDPDNKYFRTSKGVV